jgi:hypothetical protein
MPGNACTRPALLGEVSKVVAQILDCDRERIFSTQPTRECIQVATVGSLGVLSKAAFMSNVSDKPFDQIGYLHTRQRRRLRAVEGNPAAAGSRRFPW